MTALEAIVIILVLIFSYGNNADMNARHDDSHSRPSYESCEHNYSVLHVESKSQYSNATHITHIDFTELSRQEAESEVRRAYHYWGDRVGPDAASWFVSQARGQGVHIYLAHGGVNNYPPIDRISLNYDCWR